MAVETQGYQVLARKYRPQSFAQIVGQEHITRTLKNAIAAKRIAHAYLFVGPRGIGKTSTARIMAMALNCPGGPSADFDPEDPVCREIAEGRSLDVREIDGASNNSVDQIRDLREDARYQPQSGRHKIYIIDEVHMLTPAAFNALLKTLEEPPPHVKFIFATTEVHKVLPTILSRCQRFDLRRIPAELIVKQLAYIAEREGIDVERGALEALARFADGGLRDAESSFDQLIAFCGKKILEEDVLLVFGLPAQKTVAELAGHLMAGDAAAAWSLMTQMEQEGKDLTRVLGDTLGHLRRLLVFQRAPAVLEGELTAEQSRVMEEQSGLLSPAKLLRMVELLSSSESRIRFSLSPKIQLEVTFASACEIPAEVEIDEVLRALGGEAPAQRVARPTVPMTRQPVASPEKEVAPLAEKPSPAPKTPAKAVEPAPKEVTLTEAWETARGELGAMFREGISAKIEGDHLILEVDSPTLVLVKGSGQDTKINKRLAALTKREVKVDWIEVAPPPPLPDPNQAGSSKPGEPDAQAFDAFKNDPAIKEALERFGAKIIEVKKGKKS